MSKPQEDETAADIKELIELKHKRIGRLKEFKSPWLDFVPVEHDRRGHQESLKRERRDLEERIKYFEEDLAYPISDNIVLIRGQTNKVNEILTREKGISVLYQKYNYDDVYYSVNGDPTGQHLGGGDILVVPSFEGIQIPHMFKRAPDLVSMVM